jgi:CheY-like chemotaxis protein
MIRHNINIQGLTFLVADANPFVSAICLSILRGFGASKIVEAHSGVEATKVLQEQKIDLMLCDANLPPDGAFRFTASIRQDATRDYRTIPIVILTSDTSTAIIRAARDCGANMVVAKPMSPAILYDRLAWVALTPRKFIDASTYFGPDRRFKIEGFPDGVGRRKEDKDIEVGEDNGPAMSQNQIDDLFKVTRSG